MTHPNIEVLMEKHSLKSFISGFHHIEIVLFPEIVKNHFGIISLRYGLKIDQEWLKNISK